MAVAVDMTVETITETRQNLDEKQSPSIGVHPGSPADGLIKGRGVPVNVPVPKQCSRVIRRVYPKNRATHPATNRNTAHHGICH